MNIICKRFPHVNQMVLKNLDDQSLNRSKETNRGIAKFLENNKLYWIRIMKKYVKNCEGFEELWKEFFSKTPINVIKQLVADAQEFFKLYPKLKLAPIHIGVAKGNLYVCQYIIAKSKDKNPKGSLPIYKDYQTKKWEINNWCYNKETTPFHIAAMYGNLEILIDVVKTFAGYYHNNVFLNLGIFQFLYEFLDFIEKFG